MNESSSFGYQESVPGETAQPPPATGPLSPGQYRFTAEELAVLGECNRESFFQRSLPLGTVLGLGTVVAIQKGHLKPNPRFGVLPKVTLAVVMGYFIGKLSYQQACAEKLMAIPGSYIGQLLRDRRDGKVSGTGMQKQIPSMFGAGPSDIYSDAGPGSSLNLDTDRPLFNDDNYRPDDGVSANTQEAPTRTTLSYEELRRRNRGEYTETKQDPYKVDPNTIPTVQRQPSRHTPPPSTNKYGDSMD